MPPETVPPENVPVLTDPQNWASRSHPDLYAAVHYNNDPGQAGQIGSEWGRYGTELTEAARAITKVITDSETKWTGDAAEGARAAMKRLSDWVDETARTAVQVGDKVAEQGRVMENARAQMPAPVQFDYDQAAAALSQPGTAAFALATIDIAVTNARSRAAHDQAVAVMTTMENNSRQIDTSTPAFTPPFNPNTGEVEQPVPAARMLAGTPTFGSADALTATHAASAPSVATAPTPTGASGGVPQGGAGYQPAAASYTPQTGAGGGGGGGVTMPTPQPYSSGSTNTAGATYTPQNPATYTPQLPQGGGNTYTGGTDYKPQYPTGTPYTGPGPTPRPQVPSSLTNPGNYLPKDTPLPKGTTPPFGTGPGGTGPGGSGPGGAGGGPSAFKAARCRASAVARVPVRSAAVPAAVVPVRCRPVAARVCRASPVSDPACRWRFPAAQRRPEPAWPVHRWVDLRAARARRTRSTSPRATSWAVTCSTCPARTCRPR
ncbi:hypothetical protein BBK82_31905 [Lentzea guizhouensis]|uniref:PPE domain-containing protein n=1 Tax=Lentzea guizhouensis TaxID=1586287 RepID=A0A1B2HQH3_9PSEU|nr:PPE domain-containing protein [Lentzea guizhouensis]ANZ39968.1 hypothetical protein BBK82_31905 [Lentzea guizhouensis]